MRIHTMLYPILCCCFTVQLHAITTYKVKIGTFAKKIPFTHFAFSGINDIYLNTDKSNIHHYYLRATFHEYQKAKAVRDRLVLRGFQNASVVNLEANNNKMPAIVQFTKKICQDNTIYFGFDDYRVNAKAQHQLDTLVKLLQSNPKLSVAIIGFTDSKGDASYNVGLSKNRVRSVKRYLLRKGISSSQIMAKACGEASPAQSNTCQKGLDLPENRKRNRRVILLTLNHHGELIKNTTTVQSVHPVLERKARKD